MNNSLIQSDALKRINSQKTKVMIVDDAVLMRNAISIIVESDNSIEVVERACNGQDALDKLKQLPFHLQPEVIITDIEMPQMDGLTLLKHLKLRSKARVIVLSSKVVELTSPQALEAKKLGAAAVLSKPSGSISFDLEAKRGHTIVKTIKRLAGVLLAS